MLASSPKKLATNARMVISNRKNFVMNARIMNSNQKNFTTNARIIILCDIFLRAITQRYTKENTKFHKELLKKTFLLFAKLLFLHHDFSQLPYNTQKKIKSVFKEILVLYKISLLSQNS